MLYFFLARERPASTDMQRFARKRTVCGEQISVCLFTALFLIDNPSRTQFFLAEKQSADRGFHNKKLKSTFIQDRVSSSFGESNMTLLISFQHDNISC